MRRKQDSPEVFRITGARQGLQEDVQGRQRRYIVSMLIRTVSVIVTALLWNVQLPLAVVTLVVGMLLPYVAVVVANAGRENAPSLPGTFVSAPSAHQLPSPETSGTTEPRESGETSTTRP